MCEHLSHHAYYHPRTHRRSERHDRHKSRTIDLREGRHSYVGQPRQQVIVLEDSSSTTSSSSGGWNSSSSYSPLPFDYIGRSGSKQNWINLPPVRVNPLSFTAGSLSPNLCYPYTPPYSMINSVGTSYLPSFRPGYQLPSTTLTNVDPRSFQTIGYPSSPTLPGTFLGCSPIPPPYMTPNYGYPYGYGMNFRNQGMMPTYPSYPYATGYPMVPNVAPPRGAAYYLKPVRS